MRFVVILLTILCLFPIISHAQNLQLIPPQEPSERVLYLVGPIDDVSSQQLINELIALDKEDPGKEIELDITSPGGIVYSGLAIYDVMRGLSSPVKTVCVGYCMSMGAFLLAVGTTREATENATIMIHQVSGSVSGKLDELLNEVSETKRLQDVMNKILSERTGLSINQVISIEHYDHFMTANQAKEYGLIDTIKRPYAKP